MDKVKFQKASGSFRGKHCVEVSRGDKVLVRNSKRPNGVTLAFTRAEWRVFIRGVKANEFDIK